MTTRHIADEHSAEAHGENSRVAPDSIGSSHPGEPTRDEGAVKVEPAEKPAEPNTFVLESVSTTGVGQPPNVEFTMSPDNKFFTAEPEGAFITVRCVGVDRSRITLHDTVRGFISADIEVIHQPVPGHKEWEDPALYAGEIACALYWSQWRMQQVRRAP